MINFKININEIIKKTKRFNNIIYEESVTSTNDLALNLIKSGFTDDFVLIANEQTNGRGKEKKKFFSPPDNGIYMSVVLNCKPQIAQLLFARTSVAIAKSLSIYKIPSEIKWPNDILLNQKKICGILIESIYSPNATSITSVIGIGINIHNKEHNIFKTKDDSITSLNLQNYTSISRNDLISEILNQLETYTKVNNQTIISEYEKHLIKNKKQTIVFQGFPLTCEIIKLTPEGQAKAKTITGETITLI